MSTSPTTQPTSLEQPPSPRSPHWLAVAAAVGIVVCAGAVLACSLLLVSLPGPPTALVQAIDSGHAPPIFRGLVDLLSLNYDVLTTTGSEIKFLPIGVGVVIGAVFLAVAGVVRGVDENRSAAGEDILEEKRIAGAARWLGRVGLVDAAQGLLVLVVVWSLIALAWSPAPDLSIRAAVVLGVQAGWALVLSRGLAAGARPAVTARAVAAALVIVCTASAIVAIWLQGIDRWPVESFMPVGRSQVFAACMLPGLVLAAVWGYGVCRHVLRGSSALGMSRWVAYVLGLSALIVAIVVLSWGIVLAGSRAAWLGCGAAAAALAGLAVASRRAKLVVGGTALIVALVVVWGLIRFARTSGALESADVRQCYYGSRYALQTWSQSGGTGMGQAGFSLTTAPRVAADISYDPTALLERWEDHAENEWFETLADLGLVGFHLRLGVFALTLLAGISALRRLEPGPARRWLIGLMAALAGMGVEECLTSGLRHEPTPTLWYTIMAGAWAIALSTRSRGLLEAARMPARVLAGAVVCVVCGVAGDVAWRSVRAEHQLAVADLRLRAGGVDRAVELTEAAIRGLLQPRSQMRARLSLARAHYIIGSQRMASVLQESNQRVVEAQADVKDGNDTAAREAAAGRAAQALWANTAFRATWDEAERQFSLSLRALGEVQSQWSAYLGRAAAETEVCQAMAQLWQLRAALAGTRQGPAALEAANNVDRYQKRTESALTAALARQPLSGDLFVALLRIEHTLPLVHVIDLMRRPLRNPLVSDEFRSVVLQVSTSEGFKQTLEPFMKQAVQDAATGRPGEWQDPFSPETMRIAAIIAMAEGDTPKAVAQLSQALRIYHAAHNRLSVQEAQVMSEIGWCQLIAQPAHPEIALEILRRSLLASDRPTYSPALASIYRRMMHVLLANGDEAGAREVAKIISPSASEADVDRMLGWSYEVLARAFHRLPADRRPAKWSAWVERAAELDPDSPDIQVLIGVMTAERHEDGRAAMALARAWKQPTLSVSQRQECLRAIQYAFGLNPDSGPLRRLSETVVRQLRAATQPTTRRAVGRTAPPVSARTRPATTTTTSPAPRAR